MCLDDLSLLLLLILHVGKLLSSCRNLRSGTELEINDSEQVLKRYVIKGTNQYFYRIIKQNIMYIREAPLT